ncbi:glycosyltransferase [Bacillus sp. HMF5848]|uniref:glycosyltransferase family 2 protein n=1 Tax=Bacillus sp. HMF5848 TaxID=2495421 RepID=UPI000F79EC03|nr:glycosyltransferase family 2 protein [Bacillus sp. HMF5848]RSK28381.1 glycosyltransferase [Bacillus sp. HMF5848]
MTSPALVIVVPCYNEEEVLPYTIPALKNRLTHLIEFEKVNSDSCILFVDDGSRDRTWSLIYKASLDDKHVKGLKLARNVGHQHALLAGVDAAVSIADCVITIDADLQDDIRVMDKFVDAFMAGHDIVYGVREKRDTDTLFKKTTALAFYRLLRKLGIEVIHNHADYRLMSKRAVVALQEYTESNLFLRGIIPLLGFKSTKVYYNRLVRKAGESKYPLRRMLGFALDGITSFSVAPIRFISFIGFLSFFSSILFGVYFLFLKFSGQTQSGWTSLITSVWLLGGLQLIAIGFVGEYIGKIYKETKRRPRYAIDVDLLRLGRHDNNYQQQNVWVTAIENRK